MTRWLTYEDLPRLSRGKQTNTLIVLAGRTAEPFRPHPCKVANSVAVFRELSWLTRGMVKVNLDHKAAGLRSARLLSLHTAISLPATSLAYLITYINYTEAALP